MHLSRCFNKRSKSRGITNRAIGKLMHGFNIADLALA